MQALLERLREPSTWAGLSILSTIFALVGVKIPGVVFVLGPQLFDILAQLAAAFAPAAAGAAVLLPERKPPAPTEGP